MAGQCTKCGDINWGIWHSASTGKEYRYCKTCRKERAASYARRKELAKGRHSQTEWRNKLSQYDTCPGCMRKWEEIPPRPDRRYKYVWTKDHITPLGKGGTDDIQNIQPLCFQCNFSKR